MNKKLLLVLAVGFACCFKVNAQQEPMFTHYMFNKLTYNPAYAGSRDAICATLVYHNQWTGFKGPDDESAPITQNFAIHAPIRVANKADLGVGFHITNDKSGFIGTTGFWGSVAYKKLLPFAQLSVGLNAGMAQQTLGAKWRAEDPNDKRLPNTASSSVFDAGFGAYLNAVNWYAGASALHLSASNAKWDGGNGTSVDYKIQPYYFLTAGYKMPLAGTDFELQPSFIVKTDFAKTVADITALALYKEKIWGGLNYRAERITALSAMIGIYPFANLSIGYSYDIATRGSDGGQAPFRGTHEIMANYCFKLNIEKVEPIWHKSPRFL